MTDQRSGARTGATKDTAKPAAEDSGRTRDRPVKLPTPRPGANRSGKGAARSGSAERPASSAGEAGSAGATRTATISIHVPGFHAEQPHTLTWCGLLKVAALLLVLVLGVAAAVAVVLAVVAGVVTLAVLVFAQLSQPDPASPASPATLSWQDGALVGALVFGAAGLRVVLSGLRRAWRASRSSGSPPAPPSQDTTVGAAGARSD